MSSDLTAAERHAKLGNLAAGVQIDFINALRNTRVNPELPAMGVDTAKNNFASQKNQSRGQHWELANEFDVMLSQLLAQQSMAAIEFTRRYLDDPASPGEPEETPLTNVERLWGVVFPGRELFWRDWKLFYQEQDQRRGGRVQRKPDERR